MFKEKIEELDLKLKDLFDKIDFDLKCEKLKELELELSNPEIWQNSESAQKVQQEYGNIKSEIDDLKELKNNLEEINLLLELGEDENEINISLDKLKKKIEVQLDLFFLNGVFDNADAIVNIFSGAGGVDAQDWAGMLASMYQAFFKNQNWRYEIIDITSGEEGGVKNISIKVEGKYAYGLLKEEFGVHRLIRLSPFNSGHTRETSFALVEVLPLGIEEDERFKIKLEEKDLKWDYFMASGKGGQSVNTTYSAVRLTHIPTNISVQCQNERSQLQNKQMAIKYLTSKLTALEAQKMQEFKKEIKGELIANEWGSQIRNYVMHPYKLVKDTRSGFETGNIDDVLINGNLLDFIWSSKKLI